MKFRKLGILIIIAVVWVLLIPSFGTLVGYEVYAQIPTVSLPTVTGSPQGPTVSVRRDADQDSINVRAGPSAKYDIIGVLIVGQIAPAKGKNTGRRLGSNILSWCPRQYWLGIFTISRGEWKHTDR